MSRIQRQLLAGGLVGTGLLLALVAVAFSGDRYSETAIRMARTHKSIASSRKLSASSRAKLRTAD